jgi:hypothetical protein
VLHSGSALYVDMTCVAITLACMRRHHFARMHVHAYVYARSYSFYFFFQITQCACTVRSIASDK